MSPILGIIASSKFAAVGDFESIATVTVGSGGSSSITFSSIPGTYAHLQLRAIHRLTTAQDIALTFNAGSLSRRHYLYGDGATAAAGADTTNGVFASPTTADTFGATIVDFLDYANTNKTKTIRSFTGKDVNGSGGQILLMSQLYDWTGAITSITLSGPTVQQHSHFALYGIKSA